MAIQTPKDVLKFAKDNKVEAVDLKFLDLLGLWQHFTIPPSELTEELFEEGNGFDGSSIRGWQPIHASDMLVVPYPTTPVMDPFTALPTLSLICNIVDPLTKEDYSRDPRNIARKAEAYLKSSGVGDVAYFGPEPEFFVFDEVRYEQNQHTGFYLIDSAEGQWNTGREVDTLNDRSGRLVESKNLGMSELGMPYIGCILKPAPALAAFTCPTVNSYRRLVPGFEAPINLAYSSRNRSAGVRIPMYSPSPKAKRIEVRFPDPACNGYIAFSAMLMAGLDGVERRLNPGNPLDKDIYALTPEELKDVPKMPGSLDEALEHLKRDHDFLLKGDVFTADVIETWIEWKMANEVSAMRLRPHPYEFALYFDA